MEEGIMLEIVNLHKYYYDYNTFHALKDINLTFKPGEFVAVLGESGSGKSTLLNVISGLDRYDSGDILLNGKSTKNFTKRDWAIFRNNYVGFIFQEYNLVDHLTLVENVELPLLLQGVSNQEARSRAIEKCKLLGLENHLNKIPSKLSGGQQQRAAIARSLVTDPVVLLADEPTGALDSENGEIILSILKKLSEDYIVILVTHDEDNARKYADRIVLLEDGRVISDDQINQIETTVNPLDLSFRKTKMGLRVRRKFAWNNIKKRKFRAFLTSLTMAIGLVAIFLIVFLIHGIQTEVTSFVARFLPENQYYVTPEMRLAKLDEDDLDVIQSIPEVTEAYFHYKLTPLKLSDEGYIIPYPYSFEGIPIKEENFHSKNQVVGRYPNNGNEVIVSSALLEHTGWINYELKTESDLQIALQRVKDRPIVVNYISYSDFDIDAETLNEEFYIVGIIHSPYPVAYVYNEKLVSLYELVPEKEFDFFGICGIESTFCINYDRIQVFLQNDQERTVERIQNELLEKGYVLNNPTGEIFQSINNFFRTVLYILVGTASISLIVSGILIGLIIYIAVLERVKEIGILTALGAKARNIRSLFNFESGTIGVISAIISLLFSLLIARIINSIFNNIMRTLFSGLGLTLTESIRIMRIDWLVVLVVFIISIGYAIVCGLIPAIRASRLHAIEALRKE